MTHGAEGLPWAVLRCQKGDGDDVIAAGLNVEALRALQGDTNEHSSGSEDEDGLTVVSEATTARLDALANQVKYHKHLIRKLRAAGYTQENFSNFCHSIKFARDAKVITPEKADRYFALNKHGNKAKHELDSKCYKI